MLSRSQIIIVGAVFVVVVIATLIFVGILPGLRSDLGEGETLTIWGVHDTAGDFSSAVASAKALYPSLNISYVSQNPTTYEADLLNALALGTAPDIVMIQNTWLPKYINKLSPVPANIFDVKAIRDIYPAVIEQDFTSAGDIYALPLYLDTLALFYNQDLFSTANLPIPPTTWEEFIDYSNKLKRLDSSNKIITAGAAIGGSSKSINSSSDLVYLLMLQGGTKMTSDDFSRAIFADSSNSSPADSALEFYTSFANPKSSAYTWNDDFIYSIDGFASGQVAMMFGYSHQIEVIKSKNPFLNFAIAPVPQLTNASLPVNYPNYWGLAVLNRSTHKQSAWQIIAHLTANPTAANSYATATNKPPVLRTLLNGCTRDLDLAAFCSQTLTARSWPQADPVKIDNAFSEAITKILSGELSISKALEQTQNTVTSLIQKLN